VPVSHRNYFFKSPMYRAFPTTDDHADRVVGPLSPLPYQAWHGYGVSSAHHGEVRVCRRACQRTPLQGRRRCAAGGCRFMHTIFQVHASSRAAKLASMERSRRERTSLEVDPGGRHNSLPKQPTPTYVQPRCLPPRRYPEQPTFAYAELACFIATGAWEPTPWSQYVSILFLVGKPGINHWRFIVDLRHLKKFYVRKRLRMKFLLGVRHLTRKGDYMFLLLEIFSSY
jgi:hypothetical protein